MKTKYEIQIQSIGKHYPAGWSFVFLFRRFQLFIYGIIFLNIEYLAKMKLFEKKIIFFFFRIEFFFIIDCFRFELMVVKVEIIFLLRIFILFNHDI